MKRAPLFVSIAALSIAISCWCIAQSNSPAERSVTGASNPALDRLTALVSYLETNKQTNALKLFGEYSNAFLAQQHSADIGMTLHVLTALREGRTTNAIELLEGTLDSDIIGFAASLKELPKDQRDWLGVRSLSEARSYRDKYPHKHRYQNVDDGVADAFKILEEKTK